MYMTVLIPTCLAALLAWWGAQIFLQWRLSACGLVVVAVLLGGLKINGLYAKHLVIAEAQEAETRAEYQRAVQASLQSWALPEAQRNYRLLVESAHNSVGRLAQNNAFVRRSYSTLPLNPGMLEVTSVKQYDDMTTFLQLVGWPADKELTAAGRQFILKPIIPLLTEAQIAESHREALRRHDAISTNEAVLRMLSSEAKK
jgi:hypothetical protein